MLPPNIPEFEIEYPGVAFVSSTVLDGDRSLIRSAIARNIAQNWTGNIVTCKHFEHLWLTKSFSTFIFRKIMGLMFDNEMKTFLEMKGFNDLKEMVN